MTAVGESRHSSQLRVQIDATSTHELTSQPHGYFDQTPAIQGQFRRRRSGKSATCSRLTVSRIRFSGPSSASPTLASDPTPTWRSLWHPRKRILIPVTATSQPRSLADLTSLIAGLADYNLLYWWQFGKAPKMKAAAADDGGVPPHAAINHRRPMPLTQTCCYT